MRGSIKGIIYVIAAATLFMGVVTAAQMRRLADINVSGNELTGTKDCAGGKATINGNENKLTLKNCKRVVVSGNENKLELVAAGVLEVLGNKNVVEAGRVSSISTMGNKNTVFYKVGPDKKKPRISNLGTGNKISAR